MKSRICPVCGLDQDTALKACPQCDWDFPLYLGRPDEDVRGQAMQKLDAACEAWKKRSYDPSLRLDLVRDAFETEEEFMERQVSRPYAVGQGVLQKASYDILSQRFPVVLNVDATSGLEPHVESWRGQGSLFLTLDRDAARSLYGSGPQWPVYAWLKGQQGKPEVDRLEMVTPGGALPLFLEQAPPPSPPSPSPVESKKGRGKFYDLSLILGLFLTAILYFLFFSTPPYKNPETYSNNPKSYKDLGDGTVLDTKTDLQWMRCSLGQSWNGSTCTGDAKTYTWKKALKAASSHRFAGKSDWRVPTIKELNTLVVCSSGKREAFEKNSSGESYGGSCEGEYQKPTLHAGAFPNTPSSWFWSSSPYANSTGRAWGLHFNYGGVGYEYKYGNRQLRLVRAGQ